MANVSSITVKLGLVTFEWEKGANQAKRQAKELKDAIKGVEQEFGGLKTAAAVGGAALIALAAKAGQYADSIIDAADANEIAAGKVLQVSQALQDAGGKAEDVGKVFSTFTKFIDMAAEGGQKQQEIFAKLGVSLDDLRKLSPQELFQKTAESLGKIQDPLQRNAAALQLFGNTAKTLDLTKFAEDIAKPTEKFDEQGEKLRELSNSVGNFEVAARNMLLAVTEALGPAIKKISELAVMMSEDGRLVTGIKAAAVAFGIFTAAAAVGRVIAIANSVIALTRAIWAARAAAIAFSATPAGLLLLAGSAIAGAVVANKVYEDAPELKDVEAPSIGDTSTPGASTTGGGSASKGASTSNYGRNVKGSRDDAIASARATYKILLETNELKRRGLEIDLHTVGLAGREADYAKATLQYAQDVAAADAKRAQAKARSKDLSAEELALIDKTYKEEVDNAGKVLDIKRATIDAEVAHAKKIADINERLAQSRFEQEKRSIQRIGVISEKEKESERHLQAMIELEAQLELARASSDEASIKRINNEIARERERHQLRLISVQEQIAHAKKLADINERVARSRFEKEKLDIERAGPNGGYVSEGQREVERHLQAMIELEAQLEIAKVSANEADIERVNNEIARERERHQVRMSNLQDEIALKAQALEQAAQGFTALGRYSKEAFALGKAFSIASAVINTYQGATKALASYPPPFNYIAAAGVIATGLAQVATIRAQQFQTRALGGPVDANTPYLVGEQGPELITPRNNANVVPNSKLKQDNKPMTVNNWNITGYTDSQLIDKVKNVVVTNPDLVYASSVEGRNNAGAVSFR